MRVSTLIFDWLGDILRTLLPRSRAMNPEDPTGRPFSGIVLSWPVVPALVLCGFWFGLPPVTQNRLIIRISPPTRIEVSVQGIRTSAGSCRRSSAH